MATINATAGGGGGIVQTADNTGIMKVQSNGVNITPIAWCRFNGTNGTLMAGYNIAGITRVSTGSYTLAMTNASSDANYAVCATSQYSLTSPGWVFYEDGNGYTRTAASFRIQTANGTGVVADCVSCSVVVYGN